MENKKELNVRISELFLAKCGKNGWDRCFHGTIRRENDSDGNPVVYGKIKVNNAYMHASASTQWELGERLDDMVLMILDYGLHDSAGKTIKICDTDFFLN
jgi:hypothetical protein